MSNPFYQAMGGNVNPLGNFGQLVQKFQQFKTSFQGDPKAEVEKMLQSGALTQARHVEAALRACASLDDAVRAIAEGFPLDMAAIDLSAALDALGEITGQSVTDDIISNIFEKFCVGK